eukprot:scaffold61224_cov36-Tisochrysis_lutea.AAC.4
MGQGHGRCHSGWRGSQQKGNAHSSVVVVDTFKLKLQEFFIFSRRPSSVRPPYGFRPDGRRR